MPGARSLAEFGFRPLLQIEGSVVASADESRRSTFIPTLAQVTRNIPDRKSDAPLTRTVGFRAVHDEAVMQRHLARRENDVDGPGFVLRHQNLLPTGQHACAVERVAVRNDLAVA